MKQQNKKLGILVQSFQLKFTIMCPETMPRNLAVTRNLPNSSLICQIDIKNLIG